MGFDVVMTAPVLTGYSQSEVNFAGVMGESFFFAVDDFEEPTSVVTSQCSGD
ncbi:hypothetical protein MC7420_5138 [Coleofasciculus chthonoplastes PCC 7420]|uniref:Uncharacterized protein n=1 Tax=Coleofasciculus chthonoplastes PCC 7420 TaxID=118168 RepID=B4W1L1_9CYAN|nr:hypothetical protein MC7420_5138 [Coleofasciculus chthonoplastes PCC 7420]